MKNKILMICGILLWGAAFIIAAYCDNMALMVGAIR